MPPLPENYESHMTNLSRRLQNDFEEVEPYLKLMGIKNEVLFVQLRGFRGAGKCYLLDALMRHEKSKLEEHKQASIVWLFPKINDAVGFNFEIKKMADRLLENTAISAEDHRCLMSSDNGERLRLLLNVLQKRSVSCVVGFQKVDSVLGKELKAAFQEFVEGECTAKFRAYLITERKHSIFDMLGMNTLGDRLLIENVTGFTDHEAVKYLKKTMENLEINDAEEIASYFGNNPLLLNLFVHNCSENEILPREAFEKMRKSPRSFFEVSGRPSVVSEANKDSYHAMTTFMENEDDLSEQDRKCFNLISLMGKGELSLKFVEILCQVSKEENVMHTFLIGATLESEPVDAKQLLKRAEKFITFLKVSEENVRIPGFFMDIIHCRLKSEEKKLFIKTALNIFTRMFNKDNRDSMVDWLLAATRNHIDAVAEQAQKYLETNFTLGNQNQEEFDVLMSICKLYEIKGQALVQSRVDGMWKEALMSLLKARDIIWQVVCSYKDHGCLRFIKSSPDKNLLEYQKTKPAADVARKVAKSCIEAGKKINADHVAQYFTNRIKLRPINLEEFAENYSRSKGIPIDDAKDKLSAVYSAVKDKGPLKPDHVALLRDTGNFLTAKQLQQTFLAAQLCGIFHTYGRQDLYLWREMAKESKDYLEKCTYYTELSHQVARHVREKTGVGLLYEHITRMNNKVPRALQTRNPDESKEARKKRLLDVDHLCREALEDESKCFEDGCYMATKFSQYSQLNAYKYMVKAANKRLRDEDQSILPPDAVDNCILMEDLAVQQISLDMAPSCIVMAAKFYASMQLFPKTFAAFRAGLKTTKDSKVFGVYQQEKQRPKLMAWTAYNFTRAVKSYFKYAGEANAQEKANLKNEALSLCRRALDLEKQTEEWKKNMQECINGLGDLH